MQPQSFDLLEYYPRQTLSLFPDNFGDLSFISCRSECSCTWGNDINLWFTLLSAVALAFLEKFVNFKFAQFAQFNS